MQIQQIFTFLTLAKIERRRIILNNGCPGSIKADATNVHIPGYIINDSNILVIHDFIVKYVRLNQNVLPLGKDFGVSVGQSHSISSQFYRFV